MKDYLELLNVLSHALAWSGVNSLAAHIYRPLNLRHARAWDNVAIGLDLLVDDMTNL